MAWTERYVSVAGGGAHDGTTEADAWTLAEAIAAYASGQRINVKAGTYANTTTNRTLATAGTTTAPIWWRGYNAAIGDLDADFVTAKPAITFTTGQITVSGAHQILSNLSVLGTANTSTLMTVTGGRCKLDRLRVENQGTNVNSRALQAATIAANEFSRCWFKATSSATEVVLNSVQGTFIGCTFVGGGHGLIASGISVILFNLFDNNGGDAIRWTTANLCAIVGNTIYSPSSDGIRLTAVPASTSTGVISTNLFHSCGGYDIENTTGANTNHIHRAHNVTYSFTSGHENGFGDSPAFTNLTSSGDPLPNAGTGDFTPASDALGAGIPGLFENLSLTSYLDAGAVQKALGGGASMLVHPGMAGGMRA